MATNKQIRDGIAARLETIADLQVYATPPGSIVVPAGVVRRRSTTYDVTFDGVVNTTWTVTVFVQFANNDSAAEELDKYVSDSGDQSIKTAIDGDPTLGGVVHFADVSSAEGERVTNYGGIDYLSVDFNIEIGD
jgi:hypothetical protein